jgi:hypothetical protein
MAAPPAVEAAVARAARVAARPAAVLTEAKEVLAEAKEVLAALTQLVAAPAPMRLPFPPAIRLVGTRPTARAANSVRPNRPSPDVSSAERAAPRTRTARRARSAAQVAFARCSPRRADASAFSGVRIPLARRMRFAALRACASPRAVWAAGSTAVRASPVKSTRTGSPSTGTAAHLPAATRTDTYARPATGAPPGRWARTCTNAMPLPAIRRAPLRARPTWSAIRRRSTERTHADACRESARRIPTVTAAHASLAHAPRD